jgi:hypothetical protein
VSFWLVRTVLLFLILLVVSSASSIKLSGGLFDTAARVARGGHGVASGMLKSEVFPSYMGYPFDSQLWPDRLVRYSEMSGVMLRCSIAEVPHVYDGSQNP